MRRSSPSWRWAGMKVEDIPPLVPVKQVFEPDPAARSEHDARFAEFVELYSKDEGHPQEAQPLLGVLCVPGAGNQAPGATVRSVRSCGRAPNR